jgi:hypothetical protein
VMAQSPFVADAVTRIKGLFAERPGTEWTVTDAARLSGLEVWICRAMLDALHDTGFLTKRGNGSYVRRPARVTGGSSHSAEQEQRFESRFTGEARSTAPSTDAAHARPIQVASTFAAQVPVSSQRVASVLIIESNPELRAALVQACQERHIAARGILRIAEIEQWPAGQIVVTDVAHLTPLWKEVGARAVIVLVDRPEEGIAGLANGATEWLCRDRGQAVQGIAKLAERLASPSDPVLA